ncbi:MAG: hypothetical protein Q9198_003584 [Flavoplaca austrocitrina]
MSARLPPRSGEPGYSQSKSTPWNPYSDMKSTQDLMNAARLVGSAAISLLRYAVVSVRIDSGSEGSLPGETRGPRITEVKASDGNPVGLIFAKAKYKWVKPSTSIFAGDIRLQSRLRVLEA